jgi:hypothetical protein
MIRLKIEKPAVSMILWIVLAVLVVSLIWAHVSPGDIVGILAAAARSI